MKNRNLKLFTAIIISLYVIINKNHYTFYANSLTVKNIGKLIEKNKI